ncbi:hypothetical protein CHU92_12875 [Flavobacterium cyanobacteriorum]|uniref:DarT domain-containing protein n=1 Tax=Flavobacterium cyanobacteriorum TaxID=2022802 RepID=A0A255YXY1_9FLAO|nr:DUF4433 domain-containing protein [Flavobacterium cyanobacteriorum]OYQ33280.1 hypothetical protein CHU92_12875 [Flavobacterium cyanobacteriorum]
MPGQIPLNLWIYRIIHIHNLEYLLTNGLHVRNHKNADPNYINIGDSELIAKRNTYKVKIDPPNGNLGDYVPFYFGRLSPMLLKIKNGTNGITKRSQDEIVYIVCDINNIVENCKQWCFTNGHAKNAITEFYNNLENLNEVDWNIVNERYWNNTDDDFDRMRRKQAEFLIRDYVPVVCIKWIIVNSKDSFEIVETLL